MLGKMLLLALAGGVGTLGRFGLSALVSRWSEEGGFPWHTLAVNIVGCFIFGLCWAASYDKISHHAQLAIFVGLLGGFTTFSAFAAESGHLIDSGKWMLAFGNIAMQNVVGIGLFFMGMLAGKAVV